MVDEKNTTKITVDVDTKDSEDALRQLVQIAREMLEVMKGMSKGFEQMAASANKADESIKKTKEASAQFTAALENTKGKMSGLDEQYRLHQKIAEAGLQQEKDVIRLGDQSSTAYRERGNAINNLVTATARYNKWGDQIIDMTEKWTTSEKQGIETKKQVRSETQRLINTVKDASDDIDSITYRYVHWDQEGRKVVDTTTKQTRALIENGQRILEVTKKTERTVDGMKQLSAEVERTGKSFGVLQYGFNIIRRFIIYRVLYEIYSQFKRIVSSIIQGIKNAISSTIQLFTNVTKKVFEFASAATEVGVLSQSLAILAQRTGVSTAALNAASDALQRFGVKTEVAERSLADFMKIGLDVEQVSRVAEIAANMAAVTGKDITTVYKNLYSAIVRGDAGMLRSMNISIDVSKEKQRYAAELGKEVKMLNERERAEAILQAVLRKGAAVYGLYETAAARVQARAAELEVLKRKLAETIGKSLIGAYEHLVNIQAEFLEGLIKETKEGGRLYDTLINISARLEVFLGGLRKAAQTIFPFVVTEMKKMGDWFVDLADRALVWGVNFIVQYGTGIIKGATSVITTAAHFISGLLNFFFAPGSPPRIAPDIDLWGAETMNEWLKGFMEADFDILEGVQAPLKQILQVMVGQQRLAQEELGRAYVDLSREIIQSLSETGKITEDVMKDVRMAVGEYADDLAKLVKIQYDVALATQAVEEAEKRLEALRKKEEKLTTDMREALAEYNRMLRAGTGKTALKYQRERINAIAKEREETTKQRVVAEDQVEVANENLDNVKERLDLQERVLNQLIDFGQMLAVAVDKEKALKDSMAGVVDEAQQFFDEAVSSTGELNKALEELKSRLEDAFEVATRPLHDWWFGQIVSGFEQMGPDIWIGPEGEIHFAPEVPRTGGAQQAIADSLQTLRDVFDKELFTSIATSLETIAAWIDRNQRFNESGTAEEKRQIFESTPTFLGRQGIAIKWQATILKRVATEDAKQYVDAFSSYLSEYMTRKISFKEWAASIFPADVKETFGSYWNKMKEAFSGKGESSGINAITNFWRDWIKLRWKPTTQKDMEDSGASAATSYKIGLQSGSPAILAELEKERQVQSATLATFSVPYLQWATNAANSWVSGLMQGQSNIQTALKTSQNMQVASLAGIAGSYLEWGNISGGKFADGIRMAQGKVNEAIKEILTVPDVVVRVRKEEYWGQEQGQETKTQYPQYEQPSVTGGTTTTTTTEVNVNMGGVTVTDWIDMQYLGSLIGSEVERRIRT